MIDLDTNLTNRAISVETALKDSELRYTSAVQLRAQSVRDGI